MPYSMLKLSLNVSQQKLIAKEMKRFISNHSMLPHSYLTLTYVMGRCYNWLGFPFLSLAIQGSSRMTPVKL